MHRLKGMKGSTIAIFDGEGQYCDCFIILQRRRKKSTTLIVMMQGFISSDLSFLLK